MFESQVRIEFSLVTTNLVHQHKKQQYLLIYCKM
jgi:hypothetical protein